VIPSAGLGTRLLPATKEQPKEMLPIFAKSIDGELCLKPLLQIVFENLYDVGLREFGFITGRGKRSVEDYFTIDSGFVELLKNGNKFGLAKELDVFYEKVGSSHIAFINQPKPKGFGDAVHRAKMFTGTEPFLVHAGDDLIISKKNQYLRNLIDVFEEHEASAVFCVERVSDPRKYGVIVGDKVANNLYQVRRVVEKPSTPPSNIAVVAVYAFSSRIYQAIEETPPDANGEVQLTNAIQRLIDQNHSVYAVELSSEEKRLDIGTPQSYLKALNLVVHSSNLSHTPE
jgi:UTP--glucose-1-phosphate uridylyltransferase